MESFILWTWILECLWNASDMFLKILVMCKGFHWDVFIIVLVYSFHYQCCEAAVPVNYDDFVFVCVCVCTKGVKDAVMLTGRGLILLAVCTLMIYMIQRLKSFFSPVCQEPSASLWIFDILLCLCGFIFLSFLVKCVIFAGPLHESSRLKQEQARVNQQNKHNEKAREYSLWIYMS